MKAVFHCGGRPDWAVALGGEAWPLLPVGNRPLLEYWFELCAELGIQEVRLVLGSGAEFIEAYAGNGERWGLRISYSFLKDEYAPTQFLQRDPGLWRDGLLYLCCPAFPRRLDDRRAWCNITAPAHVARGVNGLTCLFSADPGPVAALCAQTGLPAEYGRSFAETGLEIVPLDGVATYYDLNMKLVGGEITRYLQPGYLTLDGSCIGYNVLLPPSAQCTPPLIIGNDSRIGTLASVGPCVVLGSRVVADQQCTLDHCVVLDGTYIGVGIEVRGKIAAGARLIDPKTGTQVDIVDPWLLARLGGGNALHLRDIARALLGWPLALLLVLVQALPFLLLYPILHACGGHFRQCSVHGMGGRARKFPEWRPPAVAGNRLNRLFTALGLDCLPRFLMVAVGRLWLCGQSPLSSPGEDGLLQELIHYHPGALSEADLRAPTPQPGLREIEARYYARIHSVAGDAAILLRFFAYRLLAPMSEREPGR